MSFSFFGFIISVIMLIIKACTSTKYSYFQGLIPLGIGVLLDLIMVGVVLLLPLIILGLGALEIALPEILG